MHLPVLLYCADIFVGAFALYDIDKDGKITKEEMTNIVKAIFDMVGDKVEQQESPESRVNLIFTLMDKVSIARLHLYIVSLTSTAWSHGHQSYTC